MKFVNIILVSLALVNSINCIAVIENEDALNNFENLKDDEKTQSQILGRYKYLDMKNRFKREANDSEIEEHDVPILPDKCNTSYNAIATIDGEIIAFKGKYMFGPKMDVLHIRSRWKSLSSKMTHVDGVYQTKNGKVLFFRGQVVYIFGGTRLENTLRLSDLGIDPKALKIDAIFRRHDSQQTYIFIDDYYHRFDEHNLKVTGYTNNITNAFIDSFGMDTAFTYKDGITYFFNKENFYVFNSTNWILERLKPKLSANFFMNCNLTETEQYVTDYSIPANSNRDFIDEGPDFSEITLNCENPEIELCKPASANNLKRLTCTLFVLIPILINLF